MIDMAKSDLYQKINIEDVLRDLKILKGNNPHANVENEVFPEFAFNAGASPDEIMYFEKTAGLELPQDYRAFLAFTNGGAIYSLRFSPVNKLKPLTITYEDEIGRFRKLKHVFEIGSDWGGNPLAMNLQVPRGAKNPKRRDILDIFHENDETRVIAKSFGEFLYRFLEGGKIPDIESINKSHYWLTSEFEPVRQYLAAEVSEE